MSLIELLDFYHDLLQTKGQQYADIWLGCTVLNKDIKKAIKDSFNAAGQYVTAFGEPLNVTININKEPDND